MSVDIAELPTVGRMTGPEFRAFQDTRPDHECWELIAGVPVMMVPPTIAHNRLSYNFTRLLNDALEQYDTSRIAIAQSGLELEAGNYKPEPDVYVIDADFVAGQRFADGAIFWQKWFPAPTTSASQERVGRGSRSNARSIWRRTNAKPW